MHGEGSAGPHMASLVEFLTKTAPTEADEKTLLDDLVSEGGRFMNTTFRAMQATQQVKLIGRSLGLHCAAQGYVSVRYGVVSRCD